MRTLGLSSADHASTAERLALAWVMMLGLAAAESVEVCARVPRLMS